MGFKHQLRAAAAAIRSSSSLTLLRSSSERAISASRADSVARRRRRAANSLTTTEVTTYTASASQLLESLSVNECNGGRNKKLNTSIDTSDTLTANARPQTIAMGMTANA